MNAISRTYKAELYAKAIIASAAAYGDNPVDAVLGRGPLGNSARRSLNPAGEAIRQLFGTANADICLSLEIKSASFKQAAANRPGRYGAALMAAKRAIELAVMVRAHFDRKSDAGLDDARAKDTSVGLCSWPLGDPDDAGFDSCGEPVCIGKNGRPSSYCERHYAKAYAPASKSRDGRTS